MAYSQAEIYQMRLKMLCNQCGTQQRLAETIGERHQTVGHWLRGERLFTERYARRIEQKLGKPHGWFDKPLQKKELHLHNNQQNLRQIYLRNFQLLCQQFDSKVDFAKCLCINRSIIYRYLSGKYPISIKLARKIEQKLNKPVGWFDKPLPIKEFPKKELRNEQQKNLQQIYLRNFQLLSQQFDSQVDFSRYLCINKSMVNRCLKGKYPISIKLARKIEQILNKPVGWFDEPVTELLPCFEKYHIDKTKQTTEKGISPVQMSNWALNKFMQFRKEQQKRK